MFESIFLIFFFFCGPLKNGQQRTIVFLESPSKWYSEGCFWTCDWPLAADVLAGRGQKPARNGGYHLKWYSEVDPGWALDRSPGFDSFPPPPPPKPRTNDRKRRNFIGRRQRADIRIQTQFRGGILKRNSPRDDPSSASFQTRKERRPRIPWYVRLGVVF